MVFGKVFLFAFWILCLSTFCESSGVAEEVVFIKYGNFLKKSSSLRVVDGEDAELGEFYYQVYIQGVKSKDEGYACGGSIIDEGWVLTAAHCVVKDYEVSIVAGLTNYSRTEHAQVRKVNESFVHKLYNHSGITENDIALLKVDKAFKLNEFVNTIELPYKFENSVGRECVVSGYGLTNETEEIEAESLQYAIIPVVSDEECLKSCLEGGATESDCEAPKSFLCAGYKEGGPQSCDGDSGGPLVCRHDNGAWYEAGLVSNSIACSEPYFYTYYTEVSHYLDWIDMILTTGKDNTEVPNTAAHSNHVISWSCLLICALFSWKNFGF